MKITRKLDIFRHIHQVDLFAKKRISLALSFHEKAESAMSRISDVVNKIMQITGEMNIFYLYKGFKGKKLFQFQVWCL